MKYKIVFCTFACIVLLLLFAPNIVFAESNGYVIEDYKINMIVYEDNTFDIREEINVNFTSSKHGIYRKIPLKNTVERLDGTKSSNRAQISNIQVNENYTIYNKSGYKIIKIGDNNKTLKGRYKYIIKYSYNIGKDPLKDADELYFNLIGNEWDTDINKVSFNIIMPKDFDESQLGFSSGYNYSTDSSNVSYTRNGNAIIGSLNTTLYSGQALTVRLTLPEGYFVGASSNFDYTTLLQIALSIIFVIITYKMWRKYGKKEKVIKTVEFYPPNDLNSADVAFIYKGYSEKNDIISLLIYLANKGYLKIEEYSDAILKNTKSKNFKIIKIKEYDGNNEDERIFFNDLFNLKDEVTISDLRNKFYLTLEKISNNKNRVENQEKVFEKGLLKKRKFIVIMIVITFLFMNDLAIVKIIRELNVYTMMILMINIFVLTGLLKFLYNTPEKATTYEALVVILFSFICMYSDIISDTTYLIEFIIESICIATLIKFLRITKKRNRYGNEMLGKIQGFKQFLEVVEKPRLEQLVMENPEYFYNIMPYAYVLGVSKKWINKFEDLAIEAPNWYKDNSSDFSIHSFENFMNSTYNSMSYTKSDSIEDKKSSGGRFSDRGFSDGGFSGGGSSGGGSGGGGGGSW